MAGSGSPMAYGGPLVVAPDSRRLDPLLGPVVSEPVADGVRRARRGISPTTARVPCTGAYCCMCAVHRILPRTGRTLGHATAFNATPALLSTRRICDASLLHRMHLVRATRGAWTGLGEGIVLPRRQPFLRRDPRCCPSTAFGTGVKLMLVKSDGRLAGTEGGAPNAAHKFSCFGRCGGALRCMTSLPQHEVRTTHASPCLSTESIGSKHHGK